MSKFDLRKLTTAPADPAPLEVAPGNVVPLAGTEAKEPSDAGRASRIGLWALALCFGGFLVWAMFAPLDEGVPSQGTVTINTKRKAVQHPTGGIIREVKVGEGDHVKEGQTLIRMDEAIARANYETIRQQYMGLRAAQGRLQAEQLGQPQIEFHRDLVAAAATDPMIAAHVANNQQLFRSRRAGLQAEVAAMQESIRGQESMIKSFQEMLVSRRNQVGLLGDELKHTKELVREGYAPRNRQLELERMVSDSNGAIAEVLGNTARAQNAIAELRQRIVQRQQEYRKEVETQLSDVTRDVQAFEAKYRAATEDLQRVEIKSPADGQVVGLAAQTVGGVVQPGQKLMDIVPENELLLIETKVAPNLVDHVRAGLPVDIRFNAFSNSPQLVVEGKVVSVSGDLLADPGPNGGAGPPYYLARVAVTPEGYKKLGKRVLQPGMPVEVVVKTGERSLMTYLLHPLLKRVAASMKEQ